MLTDTKLRSLKPRDSAYRLADTNGLCIEVRSTGAKVWRYRYRYAGKASIVTMAEYPAMALSEARAERDRLRALVKGGANPAQVARIDRAATVERSETTFAAIASELLAKRAKEGLSPGSVKRERRLFEKDLASIGDMPVTDITAPVLLAALRKLERRGVVETAHRARSLAGRVFRYAIATGRAKGNPADNLAGAFGAALYPCRLAIRVRGQLQDAPPDAAGKCILSIFGVGDTPIKLAVPAESTEHLAGAASRA